MSHGEPFDYISVEMSWYTRRNFIKRAVAASGTLGFATGCRRLQVTGRNDLSRGAPDRLRAKLKGRLILPTDPSYENARRQRSGGRGSSCNA